MTQPCRMRATPDVAEAPIVATTWVSLQLCTTPLAVPSHTWPLCGAPKPAPVMVTAVTPGTPLSGATVEIVAVFTAKSRALDQVPPCRTRTAPDVALQATVATICVSLQLTTLPAGLVPSHTVPVACGPKPEPLMVTCVFAAPVAVDRLVMIGGPGGLTVNVSALLVPPLAGVY